jgi:hypothetical protein
MNEAGRWRCYLGWMLIHTVMTTSSITRGRLRQGTWGKRMSTFSIRLACLRRCFQELPPYSDDKTVRWYKFYSVHEFIL